METVAVKSAPEMIHYGTCVDCGKEIIHPAKSLTTGFGWDENERGDKVKVCFACCGYRDKAEMILTGRATLYLSKVSAEPKVTHLLGVRQTGRVDGTWKITNWPGTLKFEPGMVKRGRHNIAGTRYDVWFCGPDGFRWHGVSYGGNTQILHCKRTKDRVGGK